MSIQIRGLDRLYRKLGKLAAAQVLERPMQRAVLRVLRQMQNYPPQPSGSRYRRTGTLGRRWTTRITKSGGGVEGRVGNNAAYGPFVQSHQYQTAVHRRTGWITDDRVMRQEAPAILADFQREIDRALQE